MTPLPDKLRNLLCAVLFPPIHLLAREPHNAKPLSDHRPIALSFQFLDLGGYCRLFTASPGRVDLVSHRENLAALTFA